MKNKQVKLIFESDGREELHDVRDCEVRWVNNPDAPSLEGVEIKFKADRYTFIRTLNKEVILHLMLQYPHDVKQFLEEETKTK